MELNREQIIKALKCCINHEGDNCHICPYHYTLNGFNHNCKEDMCEDALALIKELIDSEDYWKRQTFNACMDKGRLDDKIKELTEENEFHRKTISKNAQMALNVTVDEIEKAKADTVRKMQELTKVNLDKYGNKLDDYSIVDQTAEEMLEESK